MITYTIVLENTQLSQDPDCDFWDELPGPDYVITSEFDSLEHAQSEAEHIAERLDVPGECIVRVTSVTKN
jgi:hypothetical protein